MTTWESIIDKAGGTSTNTKRSTQSNILSRIPIDAWCIVQQYADEYLMSLMGMEASWMDDETPKEMKYEVVNGVGVLAISGPMTRDPHCMMDIFGGTSTTLAKQALRKMSRDSSIGAKKVILAIDSPGGQVNGTEALAEEVNRLKSAGFEVVASINGLCCSAAYWIAAQCDAIYANSTDTIGSIGTYMVISDYSAYYEKMGIKRHLVASGKHKGVGTPGIPISKEQLDKLKANVNEVNQLFIDAVQQGRGPQISTAQEGASASDVATGETWLAGSALKIGLIDGIASFEEVLGAMVNGTMRSASSTSGKGRGTMADSLLTRLLAETRKYDAAAQGSGNAEDDTEDVAAVAKPGMFAKVAGTLKTDPRIAKLNALGIESTSELDGLARMAKIGQQYLDESKAYAEKQAIRAFGPEKGARMVKGLEFAALEDVQAQALAWEEIADDKFGVNKDGKSAGERTSASNELPQFGAASKSGTAGQNAESNTKSEAEMKAELDRLKAMTPLGQRALSGGK